MPTQQPTQQQWNPVQAFQKKWPNAGLSDQEILTNLQNPAKFRSAFPEYTGVTDDEIRTRMAGYLPKPTVAANTPATPTSFTAPVTDTVSQYHPSVMDRLRAAFPIMDRLKTGFEGPAQTNQESLAKPLPGMSDERAIAPEQAMTGQERQAHPIATGVGEFAGGMSTPENMLLTAATAGAPGGVTIAGRAIPVARIMGGVFSGQMLRGAYQEFPAFRDAVNRQDWSEVERIGTHIVLGGMMASLGAVQTVKGASPYERYSDAGREFTKLKRQNQSSQAIETNGVGLYNSIQRDILTHVEALKNDGARTIDDAIKADKAALLNTNRGSISTSAAVAEATKALVNTDYQLKPAERMLYNELVNKPELTLEQAKHLRTAFGEAQARAHNRGDGAASAVFAAGYDQLGEGMKGRIQELQGTIRPFEHYNNQFKTAFDLKKNGITNELLKPLRGDANASIGALDKFSDANVAEIQQQMRKMGLKQQAKSLDTAQRDARVLVGAHDVANGKYQSGIYRLFAQSPKQAWPGMLVMLAAHGMKMTFPLPQLAGMVVASGHIARVARRQAGEVGLRLRSELPEESFRTRPQAEAPETFTYKDPDEGWNVRPGPTESLSPRAKAAAVKAAKRAKAGQ